MPLVLLRAGRRLVAALLLTFVALWACGVGSSAATESGASTGSCPPASPASAPASNPETGQLILACVDTQPITEGTFEHWRTIALADSEPHRRPDEHELVDEVMGFLISGMWVQGEARDLHIHVSPREVHRQFNRIRKEQFPRMRAFRRFLWKTKQTVADLLMRVKLNLLSTRIQHRVVSGHRGASGRSRALSRFVKRFRTKWKALTYCSPQYAVQDCGHIQALS